MTLGLFFGLLAVNFVMGILDLRDGQRSSQLSMLKGLVLPQEQWGVLNMRRRGDITRVTKTTLLSGWSLEMGQR